MIKLFVIGTVAVAIIGTALSLKPKSTSTHLDMLAIPTDVTPGP